MDKLRRKELKKQYKIENWQNALFKLDLEKNNPFLARFAKIRLGIDLPSVTKEAIDTATSGFYLMEELYQKILEKAHKDNLSTRGIFSKELEGTINGYSKYLKAIYHTYLFECAINVGDIDKEFACDDDTEKKQLNEKLSKLEAAYQLMGNEKMLDLIRKARNADNYDTLQEISRIYKQEEMYKRQLVFIKKYWKEFEMI